MSASSARGAVRKRSSGAKPELQRELECPLLRARAVATAAGAVTAERAGLEPIAMAIGEAWALELVRALRDDDREIVGAWPGTISEAKMRVLARLNRALELELLAELARVVTVAARHEWLSLAESDPDA